MEQLKCVVVGDGGVGKTTFLYRVTTGQYPFEYIPTVFDNASFYHEGVNISFWDTAGQDDYDRLRPLSYQQTDVFLVCYNKHRDYTYQNVLNKWLPEIFHHCPEAIAIVVCLQNDDMAPPVSLDPTYQLYKQWPEDKKKLSNRYRYWKLKKVLPLLTPHQSPKKPAKSNMFESLPDEIMMKIFGYLNTPDLAQVAKVSKDFNRLSKDTLLWKQRTKGRPTTMIPIEKGVYSNYIYSHETCSSFANLGVVEILAKIKEAHKYNQKTRGATNNNQKRGIRKLLFWK